ncbi:MAG: sugar-binding transcriptional regulator [Candidatus Excrementavichristensenella sp.]
MFEYREGGEHLMDNYKREDLLVNVAKLYYEFDYNQAMIAEKLHISRPYVSKLIREAKAQGVVTIKVHDPSHVETRTEKIIRQKYKLQRVIVIPNITGENTLSRVCAASGNFLNNILKSGDVIALGTGQTMHLSARYLIPRNDLDNLTVVSMEGVLSNLLHSSYQQETTKAYANAFGAIPYAMPLPIFFNDLACKKLAMQEPCVRQVKEYQQKANIAIFTTSNISTGKSMSFVRQGYISEAEMKEYIQRGAISNILHHFTDKYGMICDEYLDMRNTSMSLDLLREKEYRICLAEGRAKIESVSAALNGGYINVLIIDENIAEGVLS